MGGSIFVGVVLFAVNVGGAGDSQGLGVPDVGQCWTNDHIKQHYSIDDPTGFPGVVGIACDLDAGGLYDDLFDPMNSGDMQRIADTCKSSYPHDTYRQIHCASMMADDYVNSHYKYDTHSREVGPWISDRSFCRDHERAFRQVMADIGNPKVQVGVTCINLGNAGSHILNTVTVTGDDGKQYTYALDVGIWPDELDPMPGAACDYWTAHAGQGGDQNLLPPVDGVSAPVPNNPVAGLNGPASSSPVGSNVVRAALTKPASTSPKGASGEGGGTAR